MLFSCSKCGTRYQLPDEQVANRVLKVRCTSCNAIVIVRDPSLSRASHTTQWYVAVHGQQRGPMSAGEVQTLVSQGLVTERSYAWSAGMTAWSKVSQIPELGRFFTPTVPPPLPTAPPIPPPSLGRPSAAVVADASKRHAEEVARRELEAKAARDAAGADEAARRAAQARVEEAARQAAASKSQAEREAQEAARQAAQAHAKATREAEEAARQAAAAKATGEAEAVTRLEAEAKAAREAEEAARREAEAKAAREAEAAARREAEAKAAREAEEAARLAAEAKAQAAREAEEAARREAEAAALRQAEAAAADAERLAAEAEAARAALAQKQAEVARLAAEEATRLEAEAAAAAEAARLEVEALAAAEEAARLEAEALAAAEAARVEAEELVRLEVEGVAAAEVARLTDEAARAQAEADALAQIEADFRQAESDARAKSAAASTTASAAAPPIPGLSLPQGPANEPSLEAETDIESAHLQASTDINSLQDEETVVESLDNVAEKLGLKKPGDDLAHANVELFQPSGSDNADVPVAQIESIVEHGHEADFFAAPVAAVEPHIAPPVDIFATSAPSNEEKKLLREAMKTRHKPKVRKPTRAEMNVLRQEFSVVAKLENAKKKSWVVGGIGLAAVIALAAGVAIYTSQAGENRGHVGNHLKGVYAERGLYDAPKQEVELVESEPKPALEPEAVVVKKKARPRRPRAAYNGAKPPISIKVHNKATVTDKIRSMSDKDFSALTKDEFGKGEMKIDFNPMAQADKADKEAADRKANQASDRSQKVAKTFGQKRRQFAKCATTSQETVTVKFTVLANGKVSSASVAGTDDRVKAACIQGILGKAIFPRGTADQTYRQVLSI
jgi:predicted Zn finger-like uncharacterized protein